MKSHDIYYPNYDKVIETKINHSITTFRQNHPLLMKNPFRMCVIGVSGSGKSNLIFNMLLNLVDYDTLSIISNTQDGIYEIIQKLADKDSSVKFYIDINDINIQSLDPSKTNLVIFDDLITNNKKDQARIEACFSLGRHYGVSCIYISQSYFRLTPMIRNNSNYYLIFKLGQHHELGAIHRRLASEISLKTFHKMYQTAVLEKKYGFIYIDMNANSFNDKYKDKFDYTFTFN